MALDLPTKPVQRYELGTYKFYFLNHYASDKPGNKWSVSDNVQHKFVICRALTFRKLLSLPLMILFLFFSHKTSFLPVPESIISKQMLPF